MKRVLFRSGVATLIGGILVRLTWIERIISVMSGALFGDTGAAVTNTVHFLSSPSLGNFLMIVGIGLMVALPLREWWIKHSGTTIQSPPATEPMPPPVRDAAQTKRLVDQLVVREPQTRLDPRAIIAELTAPKLKLGWTDEEFYSPIGSGPGQLGVNPISVVMLTRNRAADGKLANKGVGKYRFPKSIKCPLCLGSGKKWERFAAECFKCGGTGLLPGELSGHEPCKLCDGNGRREGRMEDECKICEGFGIRGVEPELLGAIKASILAEQKTRA